MSPIFKWLPEEQAWLEAQVITNNGLSSTKDKHWLKSLVDEFRSQFPCVERELLDGLLETSEQMQARWQDIPRRVKRWVENHQQPVLLRHARNKPRPSDVYLAPKRKRTRNARDMAKACDPRLRERWSALCAQVKAGHITKSHMYTAYNGAVTQLLKDEGIRTHYTVMANQHAQDGGHTSQPSLQPQDPHNPGDLTSKHIQYTSSSIVLPSSVKPISAPEAVLPPTSVYHAPFDYTSDQNSRPEDSGPQTRSYSLEVDVTSHVESHDITLDDPAYVHDELLQALMAPIPFEDSFFNNIGNAGSLASTTADTATPHHMSTPDDTNSNETDQYREICSALLQPTSMTLSEELTLPETAITGEGNSRSSSHILPHQTENRGQSTTYSAHPQSHPSSSIDTYHLLPLEARPLSSIDIITNRIDPISIIPAGRWNLQRRIYADTHTVRSIAFSHDGNSAVTGFSDNAIRIWDIQLGGTISRQFRAHKGRVQSVAFSPDDKRIVSGSSDKKVCIWDSQTGRNLRRFRRHTDMVFSVAFSPSGDRIVSMDFSNTILIWNSCSGDVVTLITNVIMDIVDFCADARYIVGACGPRVYIRSVESGEEIGTAVEGPIDVNYLWFNINTLYSRQDGQLHVWEQTNQSFEVDNNSALSADRRRIACFDEENIYIFSQDPSPVGITSTYGASRLQAPELFFTENHSRLEPDSEDESFSD